MYCVPVLLNAWPNAVGEDIGECSTVVVQYKLPNLLL